MRKRSFLPADCTKCFYKRKQDVLFAGLVISLTLTLTNPDLAVKVLSIAEAIIRSAVVFQRQFGYSVSGVPYPAESYRASLQEGGH